MATATITFHDSAHGTIEISGEVDPPIDPDIENTPAQEIAFRLLQELYKIEEAGKLQRMTFGGIAKGDSNGQN